MTLNRFQGGIDLTMLKHTWQGEWDEGRLYNINEVVGINGRSYVCINTEMSDEGWYGTEYKPGYDTIHWAPFTDGYLFKGQWRARCRWYKGDVVKFNGDYYVALEDNLHGHPIYENAELTTKWRLVFKSSERVKTKRHVWYPNMAPIGWTRNYASNNTEHCGYAEFGVFSINGDYNFKMMGYSTVAYNQGMGTIATWNDNSAAAVSDSYIHPRTGNFDFWDYLDGNRPSLNGGTPRVIQVVSNAASTYVLFDTGEVYASGYNGDGQLVDGTTTNRPYFVRCGRTTGGRGTGFFLNQNIIKVASSAVSGSAWATTTSNVGFLTKEGRVWTCGYNGYGQLGDGTVTARSTPYLIPHHYFNGKKVIDLWMSGRDYQFTVAQTEDDCLYVWGYNGYATGPGTQNLYTPKKVAYDFRQYGGIKKVWVSGSGSPNYIFVLTNDGQLHFAGYHYNSQNHTGGKGGNGGAYWQTTFTTMHQLLRERKNSIGRNGMHDLGSLIDISYEIDDFWVAGEQYPAIWMKQKKTGIMYEMGHRNYVRGHVHARAAGMNDYYGNNPSLTSENITLPTPINVGDFTDIVQIAQTYISSDYKNLMFLNSDGRLMSMNMYNSLSVRGTGAVTAYPLVILQQQAIQWEGAYNHQEPATPTLFRWKYPVSLVQQAYADTSNSQSGVSFITENDRMMFAFRDYGYARMPDSGQQTSQTGDSKPHAVRLDF